MTDGPIFRPRHPAIPPSVGWPRCRLGQRPGAEGVTARVEVAVSNAATRCAAPYSTPRRLCLCLQSCRRAVAWRLGTLDMASAAVAVLLRGTRVASI